MDNGVNGFQRTFQVEQLVLLEVRTLQAQTTYRFPYIKEILQGKVVALLQNSPKLPDVCQLFVDFLCLSGELERIHLVLAQGTHTVSFEQGPDFVKADFLFESGRIDHCC